MTSKRKVRASEPTPSRPMTAVPPQARRRQAAPVELARALASARAAEAAADAARTAEAAAEAAEAERALARRASTPSCPPDEAPTPDTRSLRDRARAREGTAEILVFIVGNEHFGIELAEVEEAIDLPPVHHVPEMPPAMQGVMSVRDSLTSVYSPRQPLGLAHAVGACALIFRRRRSRLALIIDDVDDARSIDLAQLRDAPSATKGGVVLGVVRHGDSLLSLVDAEALLAACQAIPQPEIA